ncbi:MAG: DUF1848 domain-containing protein [Deltaproteobacteria bacterium]|nr:DUF1848 domain-containing protein [Deltaproteobacteria bacterium]
MIISASRRTDLPAFYARWFWRRIQAGYCLVPNPFNPKQVARISLLPTDVDAIVFWTRHARPLLSILPKLDQRGYKYYFQYTITGYPKPIEARTPPLPVAIKTFRSLAERIQPGTVIWRYDPIVFGPAFPACEHLSRFSTVARNLEGYTERVVISLVDCYKKTERRLGAMFKWGHEILREPATDPQLFDLLSKMTRIARRHGMAIEACAQAEDFSQIGISRTKCIDDRLLSARFGGTWPSAKDGGQRRFCGCIPSKDIGMVDSCSFGCVYCYATRSDDLGRRRYREHDESSPSLLRIAGIEQKTGSPFIEPM